MSSDVQQIKDRLEVAVVVGEYVQLKPAGINLKGLCPFHKEKSPSFMVNRERQSWHCFGCNKGGDIFSFVQEIEGMEFVEALRFLAQKAGVELSNQQQVTIQQSEKNRLKDINRTAAYFYHNVLIKLDAAADARAYLTRRNLSTDTIEAWQIGFVPDQWDLLTKYLLKKGFSIDDLVASGLTIKRDNANRASGRGYYDRFRGRIMFPICDVNGDVVGFTGRVLVETDTSGGKYVNSPQTVVYDKSRVVFGLDKARQRIREQGFTVLVEGQMDVISCHQAGMTNVVATSGTALTAEQIKLLERYAKDIRMAFDADAAGQAAAKRGIDIALEQGLNIKIIRIPEGAGKDPDECIKQNQAVWETSVNEATDVMNWYFEKSFKGRDIGDPKQKQQIANELLAEIARIPYAVERDHWLQKLGIDLHVSTEVLSADMARIGRERTLKVGKVMEEVVSAQPKKEAPLSKFEAQCQELMVLMLRFPTQADRVLTTLSTADIASSSVGPLYELIKGQYTSAQTIDIHSVRHAADSSLQHQLDFLLTKGDWEFSAIAEKDAIKVMDDLVARVHAEYIKGRRLVLEQDIARAERSKDTALLEQLLNDFQSLV